ncbi:NYN domain-containing protein [uncultured Jatrophihabitans sp.]|uniref:NYN domain-containing protein n=1 Tax=uncultured Jatrophihabitans sp. TaxID=1610747 RepID=UPI0035CC7848
MSEAASDSHEPADSLPAAGVMLVEPARAQLLELAAQVVAGLPIDEVPPALRAIARFAPAKRVRLGGPALAAALDGHEAFRAAVARTLADAAPDLVAAVRDGRPTPAADPVDLVVVAYLTRPDGWQDTIELATRRWAAERDAGAVARVELETARAELVELRARAKSEPARLREAARAATATLEDQLRAAQHALRERTRELRAAERDHAGAVVEAADAARRLAGQAAAHEAELRRLRGRLAEAERSAETARRGARSERDLDDARLWLLVDSVVQAAGGLRRELSLPAPALRPADAVAATTGVAGAAGARGVRSPAELDRLLALPHAHLIVDGYNVTKTGYGELSLADQRARLAGSLAPLVAQSGAEVTVVFDGAARPPAQPPAPRGVRVLFSAPDEIADDLIRRLVAAEPAGRTLIVVTSDWQVVTDTARDGAWTAASTVLLERLA